MRRVVTALGLFITACNTPQSAPSPRATEVDSQALAQNQPADPSAAPAPAAASDHASCGAQGPAADSCGQGDTCAACGSGSEPGTSCGGHAHTQGELADQTERAADSGNAAQLTRITDPSQVCMVRNHFMGRPQLSVAANGGTYYGCCAGCANRLLADPTARVAVDPVSHKPVDKALAVLARTARGNVLYFENEQNLSAFRAGLD